MAKKTKANNSRKSTLNKDVPHIVAYVVLFLLFFLVLKLVKQFFGVGY